MHQSLSDMMKDGHHYMHLYPEVKELDHYLVDGRVIAATRLGIRVMPALAVVCCTLLLHVNGSTYLPQALAVGAFFITLPVQGILWLGHRSNQLLPPYLRNWYKEVHAKLAEHGCRVNSVKSRPKYRELAELLKTAFSELDRVFRQQLL